ncbi:MAG TPA: hypothetical protein VGX50_16530 [Longimicrobium sp.]|jgi:sulfur carrier protein ThiS|nr:hypothetical protein [Longimicrobium sp.]
MTPLHARKPLPSHEAGARIHNLVEQVTQHPGTAVVISNGDSNDSAVLVDTRHYELLVHRAGRAANAEAGEPFRLAGSIEILVSDEELEAGIAAERRRQADLAAAKFKDL